MTQVLEAVAFSIDGYYDALQFLTISGKMKVCQRGLKWFTLTDTHPTKTIRINIDRKVKTMVKKAFMGLLVGFPAVGNNFQIPVAADTTVINHIGVDVFTRYNEWNQEFNMKKV